MTAVMTKPGKIEGTKQDELRAYVGELEIGVKKLNGSLADSRLREESLVAERGLLVLPARSKKDKGAQNRLHAIDEQLAPLKQDIADDQAAAAELTAQLTFAKNEISRAEWEERRAKARGLLVRRMESKTTANLQKAARNMASALDEAVKEDAQLRKDLLDFNPNLRGSVDQLLHLGQVRGRTLGYELIKQLPIDSREYFAGTGPTDLAKYEQDYLEEVLETLDGLELVF